MGIRGLLRKVEMKELHGAEEAQTGTAESGLCLEVEGSGYSLRQDWSEVKRIGEETKMMEKTEVRRPHWGEIRRARQTRRCLPL